MAAVVGSQKPVMEGILLSLGAKEVHTVEYNKLTINDPRVSTFQGNRLPEGNSYSVVVVADALQHDGLGRYGDPVCADADLLFMDSVRHRADLLVISLPVGSDKLEWNAHRVYGDIRLPLLLQGYQVLSSKMWTSPSGLVRKAFVLSAI
mmetsp:Transcript_25662/g.41343  ORF Transcript_25662/g.41343 Transcript_25662/m.41343 type:complete len:149 (+) Transcript_25662:3185-3631(+)